MKSSNLAFQFRGGAAFAIAALGAALGLRVLTGNDGPAVAAGGF
jgi:hypothetical protein